MNLLKSIKRSLFSSNGEEIYYRLITKNRLSVPTDWGGHAPAWQNVKKALNDDNPDFGLISAWSILEDEVISKYPKNIRKIGDRRNRSICEISSEKLNYNYSQKKILVSAMENRNKVAHGRGSIVRWDAVDHILNTAYKIYRID